jgi:hypothetical protein
VATSVATATEARAGWIVVETDGGWAPTTMDQAPNPQTAPAEVGSTPLDPRRHSPRHMARMH